MLGAATMAAPATTTEGAATLDAVAKPRSDFGGGKSTPVSPRERRSFHRVNSFLASLSGDLGAHRRELAEHGLQIVSDIPTIAPTATDNGDISLPRPYVLYNTQQHRYFVTASFEWKSSADYWYFDGNCSSADNACNVGGKDGFGFRFNRRVINRVVEAAFCGRDNVGRNWSQFGCFEPTNPEENSSQGATYRAQDKLYETVVNPDYNLHTGVISMGIDVIPCGRTLQIFSRYGHGWDDTSLTGFDVSLSGFGMQWSDSDDHWVASSQSGTWTRAC
ncbi:hypothetical protein [Nocardioides stalactiti]|uniref:hypothetical protein n=1 Tax=Nocardioides stalactiti TaxID=2755356 RepID=UPI001601000B|nr:hypothetical protein [Nocardioides stalactiti]